MSDPRTIRVGDIISPHPGWAGDWLTFRVVAIHGAGLRHTYPTVDSEETVSATVTAFVCERVERVKEQWRDRDRISSERRRLRVRCSKVRPLGYETRDRLVMMWGIKGRPTSFLALKFNMSERRIRRLLRENKEARDQFIRTRQVKSGSPVFVEDPRDVWLSSTPEAMANEPREYSEGY